MKCKYLRNQELRKIDYKIWLWHSRYSKQESKLKKRGNKTNRQVSKLRKAW